MIFNKIYSKWNLIVLLTFGFYFFGFTQQKSTLPYNVTGYWTTDSSSFNSDWQAQWIWMPEKFETDVMLARRSFNFSNKPESAKLRISASSKYELYINGKYINQGPARSASHHQSFDILEVAPLLKPSKNTIAVRVHYQQGTTSYHHQGRAGLLVQLDTPEQSIISDAGWKVHPDLSWDSNSGLISRFQLVVNDKRDLNKKITDFESVNFDDTTWVNAQPLLRNSGWPSPKKNEKATTLTTPWTNLVPRDIPYLKEQTIQATRLIEGKELVIDDINKLVIPLTKEVKKPIAKSFKKYLNNKTALLIPSTNETNTSFLLFDFGRVINGMPKLVIEGVKNTEINIFTAPYIVDNTFTNQIVDSNYHDQILLSGKKDTWRAMYFKPSRYMAIAIKGNNSALKIHFAGIHQLKFPFKSKGSISTPKAPWLEELWHASVKTLDVCTTDAFTDNYRERRQYAQTGFYAALGNYFTYGNLSLQRRYLIQTAQEQQANGIMPAYAPLKGGDYMIILDSNCLWIRSLYNYLMYSGDFKTVNELLPTANKLIQLLESYTNSLGMIDSPPYAYWLDHTLNDRRGANMNLNGHFLGALEDYAEILKWLNKPEESAEYSKLANALRTSLGLLWDEDKQLFADAYIDGGRSTQFSEHANAMALACKIATPEQGETIAKILLAKDEHNFIKRQNGMTMVTPAMSYFLHKGLADYGYEKASLQMLYNRFKKMLAPEMNGTLWEEWWRHGTGRSGTFQEKTRSDAQTESAFFPALAAQYVLGLQVTKPGMEEVVIYRPKINISNVASKIPTPHGAISIKWKMDTKSTLTLTIPKGMVAKLDVKSLEQDTIEINNKQLDFNELNNGLITIKPGTHEIIF
tara:strand:+ start:15096 stop:17678 length:2583 start_codon:yes stop_codon:yes gene_type:complete